MKKKTIYIVLIAIAVFCAGILLGVWLASQETATVQGPLFPHVEFYKDGRLMKNEEPTDFTDADIKELHYDSEKLTYISHPHGFQIDLPADAKPDFSIAAQQVRFKSNLADIVISQETVPSAYEPQAYIEEYMHRYLLEPSFLEYNRITLHKNVTEKVRNMTVRFIAFERLPAPGSTVTNNAYVYCYLYPEQSTFYRILFKAPAYNDELITQIYKTLYSFTDTLEKKGTPKTTADFHPVLPANWSAETRALYDAIAASDTVQWGAFISGAVRDNNRAVVEKLEQKIDYNLQFLLDYVNFSQPFPKEGMKLAAEMGKTVELTMQISSLMNENLAGYNPALEVLDGVHDETLRKFAQDAKEFGKPFLFRLNNEMNSDWVSYGATATLNDPDIFVALWHHIYNIFEEEGVSNAIWIFNPNNNSYPPQNYNHFLAYYPGNEYVHMYGVTGYNTGTYYIKENQENWFSFEELYDDIEKKSSEYFSKFPWIITEFGSSSIGGNKPQWITDMFKNIKNYDKIKVAVWFNADDLDPRPGKNNRVARPYRLDETRQTTEAFKKGIAAFK